MAFVEVGSAADVPTGGGRVFEVEGRRVAVFRVDGTLRAVEDRCPHQGGPLGDGELRDGAVACPWHRWEFDLATGSCLTRPGMEVSTFPAREEEGRVLLDLGTSHPAPAAPTAPAALPVVHLEEGLEGSGLDYLARRRPEAAEALRTFKEASGDHLEPLTRALIRVALHASRGSGLDLAVALSEARAVGADEESLLDAILQAQPVTTRARLDEALRLFACSDHAEEG